jgi:uncharacterized protein YjiS (DUF1127 family)
MATITTNVLAAPALSLVQFGKKALNAMVWLAEQNPRYRELMRLSAMTDEQLAKIGLKREDIPARVYGARYL